MFWALRIFSKQRLERVFGVLLLSPPTRLAAVIRIRIISSTKRNRASKMQMEMAVNEFFRAGKIETVIVRPPWFYGPNQPPRQSVFFRMIREGKAPIVGSGQNLRGQTQFVDLAETVGELRIDGVASRQ